EAGDDAAATLARQQRSTGTALVLAQGAARADNAELTFVTRSAQSVIGAETVDPTGAPLWGLARTIAAEQPGLRARRIDLPAEWAGAVPMLAEWLGTDPLPTEDELAVRNGCGFASRIVPHACRGPG